jgi:hypothetical protein
MKQSLQFRLSQHLALTPQLQQSIRLLQLSTLELNQELEQILGENPLLERLDDPLDACLRIAPNGGLEAADAAVSTPLGASRWPATAASLARTAAASRTMRPAMHRASAMRPMRMGRPMPTTPIANPPATGAPNGAMASRAMAMATMTAAFPRSRAQARRFASTCSPNWPERAARGATGRSSRC